MYFYCHFESEYELQEKKCIQMKTIGAAGALTGLQPALGYISNPLQVSSSWSDGIADLKGVTWRLYQSNFEPTDFFLFIIYLRVFPSPLIM